MRLDARTAGVLLLAYCQMCEHLVREHTTRDAAFLNDRKALPIMACEHSVCGCVTSFGEMFMGSPHRASSRTKGEK